MKIKEFKEKYKNKKEINHVVDYLNSYYKERNINFNYEQALKKADEWTEELNKKNKDLKDSGEVEVLLEFENGINFVRLLDQTAKDWEGLKMGHCVASYKNHEGIYSIRDKENIPHCTIEIDGNYVEQIKGKGNGKISPNYINYVIKALDKMNQRINFNEMKNLGYIPLTMELKESFNNLKIIKFNEKEFVYVGNNWKMTDNPLVSKEMFFKICEIGNSVDYINYCIMNGIDPSSYSNCAIVLSSQNGHLEIVKELLKDPRVNPSDQNNYAIRDASFNGHLAVVRELLKDPRVDPSAQNNYAIRFASKNGHLEIVKELLKDPRVDPSSVNNSSIRFASKNGHLEIVKELLKDPRVNPSAQNNYAIRDASFNGHLAVVRELLKDPRVDPSAQNNYAIRWASKNGHLEIVKELLKDPRVNPSAQNNYAIRAALEKGHPAVVKELLKDKRVSKKMNMNMNSKKTCFKD